MDYDPIVLTTELFRQLFVFSTSFIIAQMLLEIALEGNVQRKTIRKDVQIIVCFFFVKKNKQIKRKILNIVLLTNHPTYPL